MYRIVFLLAFATGPVFAQTQHSNHQTAMDHTDLTHQASQTIGAPQVATEAGQSAFAAIQEIVVLLMADSNTDWAKVDIAGLQAHLIDMDNLTLRALAQMEQIKNGARFTVTSTDPAVVASIQRMIPAHVATMDGRGDWALSATTTETGAVMEVTGIAQAAALQIRALGFAGVMASGMHHQEHHLALASGQPVHGHGHGH